MALAAIVAIMASRLPTTIALSTRPITSHRSVVNLYSTTIEGKENGVLASRLDNLDKPTVWHEFTPLANEYQSINLGQGFPDWDPPNFVIEAMQRSITPSFGRQANQYARANAHLPLANVLAEEYSNRWWGMDNIIDAQTQIATAVGCTNALYCALQGLIGPGDEVLLLEPAFDIYAAQVKMAGGTPVYCPLRPSSEPNTMTSASDHFTLDLDELESHMSQKTKVLLLNTPHNPTGKMLTRTELEGIAKLLERYSNTIVISDEVYEHIVFDDGPNSQRHISPATIDGLLAR